MSMTVEIKNNKLCIEIDLEKPTPSASGKTLVLASTHGNTVTAAEVNGKPITIGLNAYIKPWSLSCRMKQLAQLPPDSPDIVNLGMDSLRSTKISRMASPHAHDHVGSLFSLASEDQVGKKKHRLLRYRSLEYYWQLYCHWDVIR